MRLYAFFVLPLAAGPVTAQRLPSEAPRYAASFQGHAASQVPPLVTPDDHAREGAKAGAVILGVGGLGAGYGWCAQGDNGHSTSFGYCAPRSLIGGLIGVAIGSVLGALIGSAFPRSPPQ